MILFHGSNMEIDVIDLALSRPYKDFGKGFYLSDDEEQAQAMAQFRVSIFDGLPVVTKFEFELEKLLGANLNIKIFKDYSDEWLDFVISNREGIAIENFDFVYGPIADDRVGLQLRKFKDGSIDKKVLMHRLKFMKGITFQYFFGSYEATGFLRKL